MNYFIIWLVGAICCYFIIGIRNSKTIEGDREPLGIAILSWFSVLIYAIIYFLKLFVMGCSYKPVINLYKRKIK